MSGPIQRWREVCRRCWRSGLGGVGAVAAASGVWLWVGQRPSGQAEVGGIESGVSHRFGVVIRPTSFQPQVGTGLTNAVGASISVSCSTCHATTRPDAETRRSADLNEFHQGLNYEHGSVTCLSCHDARNYDRLHLADGRGVEFSEVMTLCAQCHGTAKRDYDRGSHGGMTGHWDLSRGSRTRNNCVHCHDAHSPKYPMAMPVFAPRDRGVELQETTGRGAF